ncbi:MAG TPA: peptidoglycan binding domain-containing protein, partial [Anaerolineae bacterium]|nr:peptidoglycan binding domain-containing protein [Anaerolineae bacterium]
MTAQTTYRTPEAPELPTRPLLLWSAIPLLLLLLGAALFFCAWVFNQRMEGFYRDRVYPHVSSLGVDLGGMTREEARQALLGAASNAEIGALTLRDGARQWVWPWTDAGLTLDVEGTLENVWAAGRAETPLREQLQLWLDPRPWEVAPRFTLDLAQTRQTLERLSAEVSTPPVQPQLALENGNIIVIPGTPGRVLDVTALLGQIQTQSAAGAGKMELDLLYRDVPPTEPDITDVQTQAEALLNRQVTLSAFDVLTEQTLTWTLGRQEFISWLRLVARADGTAAVEADPAAVPDTLKALAAQLGDGRGFRLTEAAQQ